MKKHQKTLPRAVQQHHEEPHHTAAPPALSWWELWPVLGWGLLTVYLYASGKIFYLLVPAYAAIALVGGLLLLAAFFYGQILRSRARRAEADAEQACDDGCEECHKHEAVVTRGAGLYFRSLIFILPLGIGFSLTDGQLKGLATVLCGQGDIAAATEQAVVREREKSEMERGYASVSVIGVAQRFRETQAQKVASVGMVFHRKELPADQFLLVRFRMTCCAADATPVAVPVRWADAAGLNENDWVHVFGTTDPQAKVLAADRVEPTKEPVKPYL
jgi:uncharacterized repeat protein (TIGR03943 family)